MVIRIDRLKRPIIACLVVFGLAVVASLVAEPAAAQTAAQRAACGGDAQQFCGQFMGDSRQLNACMKRNQSRLSAGCRTAMGGGKKAKKRSR